MAKKESTFINMVLALLIVTLISSATLGFVYEFTKEPIAQAQLNKKLNAIKEVVPAFNNNPNDEMYLIEVEGGEPVEAYPAKMDGKLTGTAYRTYTNMGFSGLIRIMVGLNPDGSIINISVLEHKETPGLGTHMTDDWFIGQFRSKNPESFKVKVKKDGGDVDAITAATISSRAFCDAVIRAYTASLNKPDSLPAATTDTVLNKPEALDIVSNEGGKK